MDWNINSIVSGLTGAQAALDVLGKIAGFRDDAKVKAATAEMAQKLASAGLATIQASQAFMELSEKNGALQDENQVLRQQLAEAQVQAENDSRYRLVELGGQQFAYLFEPPEGDPTPRHYLCARCRAEKKNSVLQGHGRPGNLKCVTCSTVYITDRDAPRPSTAGGTEYF
ncbi:hypothetical protein [Burkholderia gladioli]|uniref:hypothetical protein n=1 Tax=Burkholderia gladioli TaxID=28095 RepID=UPI001641D2AB|nr:hypothetical protein [Burkholderia gladioli]